MKATIASAYVALAVGVLPAAAQQQQVLSDRVAKSMPSRYQAPECGLKSGHFKVSSGASYLKSGIENSVPDNQKRSFDSGEKVLNEAIVQNGQDKNPAAWYYLGRIYLQQGDIIGADTALARASQMAPACDKEINAYRQNAWVALIKGGNTFEEQKNLDSALVLYRQAGMMLHTSAIPYYQAANVFNTKGQPDSAAAYFGKAVAAAAHATDTTEVNIRNRSAFNQGALLLNSQKYPESVKAFEQYLQWVPNDNEAKRGLAGAYRGAGDVAKAQALEQQVVAAGGTAGAAAAGGGAGTGSTDLMNIGVNFYNEKKYADAATAFEKVVQAEPYNRDALFNLTNTYLALKDGPKLLATAQKLAELEPLNENVLKLVGEGYKQSKQVNEAVSTAEKVLALPIDVKVNEFAPSASGATLSATATGRAAQTAAGKPIPPKPVTLTFEFLNASGGVVGSQDVQVPALPAGASQEVKAAGQGQGISGYRYKQK
ncbi:MAG TPA: tetratricopeptide repeat protein [Gemmatimonadales bacterium]|nr:tetratricopeptide repeat protein [Gemmatimonadales bacterium]